MVWGAATLVVRPGYRQICQRWTAGKGGVFYHCDTLWLLDGQDRYDAVMRSGLPSLKRISRASRLMCGGRAPHVGQEPRRAGTDAGPRRPRDRRR